MPTDDNVAEIFEAIIPLFPTPHKTTFEEHLEIAVTALLNELLTALSSLSVGTGTGPSTPPLNAAQFAKLQTQLSTLFTA